MNNLTPIDPIYADIRTPLITISETDLTAWTVANGAIPPRDVEQERELELHERALAALFSHLQHAGGRRRDLHRQRGMPRSKLWFICLQVSISGYVQGKYVKPMTRLILS